NVISGRVANRLDLKGSNYVVDAACASSLAALHAAVQQLRAGTSDMALVGCADASNNPFTFMCFARTHALTPSGRVRPFDDRADGVVLGEGFATVVLKRLTDAESDGDRIYAVIRGVGTSSDGRNRSLTAPHDDSQALAIERAYDEACIDPSTVGLVEAHATGTAVGDRSEISAMKRVFDRPDRQRPFCAVGSVKSMIGHAKTAAGLAGLIKTVLALKNRVLPPTINVEVPNKKADFDRGPFWINTETRPWVHTETAPRRAGLSAFGFGGTNFHVALEEYRCNYHPALELDLTPRAAEIFLWRRDDRSALVEHLRELRHSLDQISPDLARLACSVHHDESTRASGHGASVRLGIIATSVDDLRSKLDRALAAGEGGEQLEDASGLYLSDTASAKPSQVAFLLPGQGSQQCHMLQDLVQYGPFGTELFEAADRLLADMLPRPLSSYIYPLPAFDRAARKRAKADLDDTRIAQPAIGLVSLFACDVLTRFGLRPAVTAGHSYGEYTALCVAGYTGRDELLRMSAYRGRAIHEAGEDHPGGMVAVAASAEETQAALDERGVAAWIANINGPSQTIIAGSTEAMKAALAQLREHGLAVRRVAVTAPFHTPAMEEPSRALGDYIKQIETRLPRIPVYSNVTAAPYPEDLEAIREQLAVHLARPVRFVEQIRAMHRDGARVFLEVGPGRILTGLVQRILGDEPHHAIAL
ncbi:MAG: type I polyketide synthase, partial [Planctomycetota bacterium]